MTAKEFRARPSSYFPELGSYEAFCLDEACAYALIALREEARKDIEGGQPEVGGGGKVKTIQGASLEQLKELQHLGRR